MHPLFLVNEGTVAVISMTVALAVAFGMVIALGAYVIYCDRLNRAEEPGLVHVADAEAVADEPEHGTRTPAAEPSQSRRSEPPPGH